MPVSVTEPQRPKVKSLFPVLNCEGICGSMLRLVVQYYNKIKIKCNNNEELQIKYKLNYEYKK